MNFVRTTSLLALATLAVAASAQNPRGVRHLTANPPPNTQAMYAMQQDLITAIDAFKAALPIYDGNRVRAINQAYQTLVIVDRALAGNNALVRTKPQVTDHVASKTAHSTYKKEDIEQSQTLMRKGEAALQQAWKDLQTAAGSTPNQRATNAYNHLKASDTEALKAISLHASQG